MDVLLKMLDLGERDVCKLYYNVSCVSLCCECTLVS